MAVASEQHDELRRTLLQRKAELAREVEDGSRRRLEEDAYRTMASEVGDAGDASTATEQADLRNSQIGRDVNELRAIDAALARIEDGTYGRCTRCGGEIGEARLRANPSAERCIACQTAYEKQFAGNGTPSL
ncbi:MAG TPA: TraR/DksA family transcriptional regulator [Burkholderiaceae bacterium]|nr:TraR/DksA family transcriptional regulator [Burkholderiaceae bacterium]